MASLKHLLHPNQEEIAEGNIEEKPLDFNNGGPTRFGKRNWPPRIILTQNSKYRLTGKEKLKNNPMFIMQQQQRLHQFIKEQKFKGFKVDKHSRTQRWHKVGFVLPTTQQIVEFYESEEKKGDVPFREVGHQFKLKISTGMTNAPLNFIQQPTMIRKGKYQCTFPNCFKQFLDKSSLNRHAKNIHFTDNI